MKLRKKRSRTKIFSIVTALLMVFSIIAPGIATAEQQNRLHQSFKDSAVNSKAKVSNSLLENFKDEETITFLVKFKEKADTTKVAQQARQDAKKASLSASTTELMVRSAVVSELKATSLEAQADVKEFLEGLLETGEVKDITPYYIVNGMAVTATKEIAEKIAGFPEVEKILPNETRQLYTATKTENAGAPSSNLANVEWNVERVNAPQVWAMGIDGSGTVVASLDTGVQWDHPALKEKYRGYDATTGQVSHTYNFFDATRAAREASYDDHGHGTHVTGTMVGSEPNGSNQIGVAPGAKWIAVKVFDGAGNTTDAILLAAAQWILAPHDRNGNVRVDLAPDVVNNSWGGGRGLDEWYRDVVINWRNAEIFPEFSAGNTTLTNPGGPGSIAVPANYPESFATGATDVNNKVASFSLRGPSPYGEVKPDIIAPGVNIRSSVPGSGYEGGWNGTSMSGPAVAAVAALLRQVNATITVDEMEQILINTAVPLTDSQYPTVPNNGYGHGLVDAYAAVSAIASGLGTLNGQVTQDGEDDEAPVYEHSAPAETYAGMELDLTIQVSDNISVSSVNFQYLDADGAWQTMEATRKSGDYKSGVYGVTVSGDVIVGNEFTYKFTINDFGNNEVTTEEYSVQVKPGITVGYFENFEQTPIGWSSFGANNTWEWGVPTSGPGNAVSGEKVYATNLLGDYKSSMNATLVMPPIDLPEGNSYLQFKQWHNFEQSTSTGRAWDYGHIVISTDGVAWTQLQQIVGISNGWIDGQVDLSAYSGQRVYIGFNAFSDGSVVRPGWYIDDVALTDVAQIASMSIGMTKPAKLSDAELEMEKEKDATETPMDPKDLVIDLTKEEVAAPSVEMNNNNLSALPLGAKVTVLENNRTVNTNPADGSYSMTLGAGTYTVKAEAYGFQSATQTVTVRDNEATTANFTLQENPQGTVSGKITDASGIPVEGAVVMLLEDANITPVESAADGSYSITAYSGEYTMKIIARGFHSKEESITIGSNGIVKNIIIDPFFTYPGGVIGYDDGTAENARAFYDAGNGWAVKMSLPEGKNSGIVTEGIFRFWTAEWPIPGGTKFAVEVWDAKGANGAPGKKLAGPIDANAKRDGSWTVVDLAEHNIAVDGDFYMVYIQTQVNTASPGLATDEDSQNAKRSYQYVSGAWSPSPEAEGNYMIRARVNYEVDGPQITTSGKVTNNANVVVEGKASPTTTITLKNNGNDVETVTIGEDGKFSFPIVLAEGENVFTAVSSLNGRVTGESAPVTFVLDTKKPVLSITSPKSGSKTKAETVTVTGKVSDTNLSTVTVNGQKAAVADNGTYSKRILLDEGENLITVVATDAAGNEETKTATISAKFTELEIRNLTPTQDLHVTVGQTVKIEFESEAGLAATFAIHMPLTSLGVNMSNAIELPIREVRPGFYVGYWTVPFGVIADGARIEVKVKDIFGNETRKLADGKLFIRIP
ncbi:S8 family serine peptidase [Sporosarcina highlanderae]|uniref:S8 family serine peptidase n=1 Tax=Sporosarcina highlanderae TaxID=3035916 RepID=A0ABT8JSI1_9BACL|nr:S8 family serine peptidase [Sporosarcina highlanderae]MDN4608070.1 S8 family serine peptidase [Sporosarcina highlanderae]